MAESHILHGVDFNVQEGEVVTLLGRNGAGKTTTMKSIMGIVGRRTGSVMFKGQETIGLMPNLIARSGIAYCPEERGIFGSLSVTENLMLPPIVARGRTIGRRDLCRCFQPAGTREHGAWHAPVGRRAADVGDRPHSAHRCQDAAAGRANRGPRAPVIVQQIGRTIREIKNRGFTVLLVEQNFRFAATVADRHYVMERGMIVDMIENAQLDSSMDKLHEYLGV